MNTGETSGNFDLDYEGAVLYATGGHLSVKRPVFARTGLFNPFFAGNALYEDVDFSFRARKCGFTIWYNPRALVYHYPSTGGGCHAEKNSPYLTTRLHNHTLFYLLHIQIIPSKHYIIYMKNLIEFISRTPEIPGIRHSPLSVTWCLLAIGKAYFDWCRSYFPLKKSVR
jgi:GT2 family glycosyltransferase